MTPGRTVRSTREQITDQLRADILTGRLEAGERVSELALAGRFGVSRGPIREALSLLTSEGFFVNKPNCGVTVAPPAPIAIRELVLPIRRTIEVYALRQIFDSLTDDDFRYWDDILFQMERACKGPDGREFPQLDLAFHRYLLERAESPDLLAIWQTIVCRMRSHFYGTVRDHDARGDLLRLHTHHADLIKAFRNGTKDEAVQALERHIDEN